MLDVGCGAGEQFGRYPAEVTEVLAIEPQSGARVQAVERGLRAAIPISVLPSFALGELPSAHFDSIVLSYVLCSVPDPTVFIAEICRLLAAQGTVRACEHVRAGSIAGRAVQRCADLVWPGATGGCHLTRDSVALLREHFELELIMRLAEQSRGWQPPQPRVLITCRQRCPGGVSDMGPT